ncbi:alpha-amylase [Pedobacter miscanthi]|uniref:alpha-amylase n=1 Tax=Pedobacter miscanthi TaxID=2259170 RepID=UPI00292F192C|nr:alpha-amylase [Pedobacter miscanthi]
MSTIRNTGLFILFIAILGSCRKSEVPSPQMKLVADKSEQFDVSSLALIPGKSVMIQGFYWNVPTGGTWWGVLQGKVASWGSAGITAVWLPPSTKCESGPNSVGYDPYDYFDFGNFNQKSTTETRYGSKTELTNLITAAHGAGLQVYADIVMNHNGGGAAQANPNTGGTTNTSFLPASGLFNRGYNDFHPSTFETADEGTFSSYVDLCHANPYVQGWCYGNSNSIAQTYKAMGYDGWRFDFVPGFHSWVVKNWIAAAGGFSVAEYWNSNVTTIQNWIIGEGNTTSAFDFPCYYALEEAFINNNLTALSTYAMLCKSNPSKAVTFVANHDINNIYTNKLSAYAFIMAHEGTPCLFYRDYEEWLDKSKLNNLIWINRNLAAGTTTVLYADNDEYIARMSGTPGLVIYINNSGSSLSRSVTTNWTSAGIKDYTGNVTGTLTTSSAKTVTINAPANSYSIWSTL